MQINLAKTAVKNLLDLINLENSTALTEAEISIGTPAVYVDETGVNDRNTQVEIAAVAGGGFTGSVFVRYYRLDLDILRGTKVLEYTKSESSTLQAFIDSIATQVGLIEDQLEMLDDQGVVMTTLPTLSSGPMTCTMRAKAASHTYIGSCAVTLNPIPVTEEPIDQTVTNQDMTGFSYPA